MRSKGIFAIRFLKIVPKNLKNGFLKIKGNGKGPVLRQSGLNFQTLNFLLLGLPTVGLGKRRNFLAGEACAEKGLIFSHFSLFFLKNHQVSPSKKGCFCWKFLTFLKSSKFLPSKKGGFRWKFSTF